VNRWLADCFIVLNVRAPTEDKIDDIKDRFYEELELLFDKLPTYHMHILLGDFNAKVGKEGILKPTTGNVNLHETKVQGSYIVTFINLLGHLLRERCITKLTTF
jgi:hypothetical protein